MSSMFRNCLVDYAADVRLSEANSLCDRIDTTMLGAIERYVKQAIVDKNAMVSSSALVAGSCAECRKSI